ncbi:chromosomal replication initiator protein DnaA [Solirubrobacter sp. CPCC 204708]|uniref:Chromosomal replication initiator protein DnaA n=1 Tax=Solirubrobacter deserti TaxID=2282478 RepID=A0ABT4RML2_9ACTN|nr:chromosomal replication initiator protein DnaA [Solirubrobacter deserti]MBE2316977.1 chromosomal replication initiator protein DnaA [Solirubrobacter deserti]MDA0139808.1 chromosomal replication initiator protein DnaA [Solirubrobacter deserti]
MSEPDPATVWHRFRGELRKAVNESTWHIWLERIGFRELDGTTIVLDAPDDVRGWAQSRFARVLNACAETVVGPGATVRFAAPDEVPAPAVRREPAPRATAPAPALNPRLTFDQFVIGESNRLAHAAALAVAETPGLAYNPLFICGPPGLGKTHLLHSIANYVHEHGGGMTARYTTAETFTDHFVAALQNGDMDAFKAAYRGVDVLLVDDVQFLARRAKTEQEFFHTFNVLHQAGAQLVLTSDRLPRDMDALEDRLRERFEAGLVCDVRPADRATRLTILRKRVAQDDVGEVDPQALELIADRVDANIRALEGALIRVIAFGSLTGRPVTAELAAEVLAGLYPELSKKKAPPTITEIQEGTCEAFGVSMDALLSASRTQPAAFARQVAMYLARELTGATLPTIGRAFGNRNHTTVLHACRRTTERMASDREAYEAVHSLLRSLGGH